MLCNIKLRLSFTDVNGNLINFFSPTIEDFKSKSIYKKVYTFTKDDVKFRNNLKFTKYPNFFKTKKTINENDHSNRGKDEENVDSKIEEYNEKIESF